MNIALDPLVAMVGTLLCAVGMNLAVAAKSGWGKSFYAQCVMERNIPEYDHVLILDYKDEYTGLVEHFEEVRRWGVGHNEANASVSQWAEFLRRNPKVQLPRRGLLEEEWREVCDKIVLAAQELDGSVLVAIDEAHFVAPQQGTTPPRIEWLATTGRSEGVSSLFITQRLAKIEETIISQCMANLFGGFGSSSDLDKVEKVVEYPKDVHNPQASDLSLPEELRGPDGEYQPVRKFEDEQGNTVGSEWIYSDDSGDRKRLSTQGMDMKSTHYAPQGEDLEIPG